MIRSCLVVTLLVATALAAPQPVPTAFTDYMISLTNYAAWDDSLTLMYTPTAANVQKYINLNLPANVMRNMPVNFVGYYFTNGSALLQLGYNYTSTAMTGVATPLALPANFTTVPANIVSQLTASVDARYTDRWTYPTNGREIMIAGCPIFHSDYTGPVGGFVLFGLFTDLLPNRSQYFMNYIVNLAAWDTSFILMQNKSDDMKSDFMASNFPFATLKNNNLNFVAYYNPDGSNFFSIGFDFTASDPFKPLTPPENFQTVPSNVVTLLSNKDNRYTDAYAYRNWLLDVVGSPIIHTDGTGPVVGFALFGRFRDTSSPLDPDPNQPSFASSHALSLLPLLISIVCFLLH